jgi:putative endonuclease
MVMLGNFNVSATIVIARRPNKNREYHDPMSCFVYVLGSRGRHGRRTYVGWTTDLDRRLSEHNSGIGARSTRGRKWILLYAERYPTRGEAMSREWHLKRDRAFRKSLWPQRRNYRRRGGLPVGRG